MKITSVSNDLVKEITKLQQRKYRDEKGLFILEGLKCIEEAIEFGLELTHIFVLESSNFFENIKNVERIETTEAVLAKISTTTSVPKAVGVAKIPQKTWTKNYKKVVLLEDIKDAGNLGTILRTACAFDIDAIILYRDTVDLYNPKCVRASVGNLWKLPVFEIKSFKELTELFGDYERVATLPKSEDSVWLKDYRAQEKILIMFGTESSGLSDELKEFATKNITIEMSKQVESLNLSISAGIILYNLFEGK